MEAVRKIEIFFICSDAREDKGLKHDLQRHLSTLKQKGRISFLVEEDLPAGSDVMAQWNKHFNSAHLFFLLMSSDFTASERCNEEVQKALARGNAHLYLIRLRPVDYESELYNNIELLLNQKPLARFPKGTREEAMTKLVERTGKIADTLLARYGLQEGDYYYKNEEYKRAEGAYAYVLGIDKNVVNGDALEGMGKTLLALKDYAKALKKYEDLLAIENERVTAHIGKAKALAFLGRTEEALGVYTYALHIDKENVTAYMDMGELFIAKGMFEKALEAYDQAHLYTPNSIEIHQKRAMLFFRLKRYREALNAYQQLSQLANDNIQAYQGQGDTLFELKEFKEAFEAYTKVKKQDPRNPHIYRRLGNTLREMHRYDEAIIAYKQAVDNDRNNPLNYQFLGDIYAEVKHYEEALAEYRRWAELDPNSLHAFISQSEMLVSLTRYEEAISAYESALRLEATNLEALIGKGKTLLVLARFKEAQSLFEKALLIERKNISACVGRADALFGQGLYKDVVRAYSAILPDEEINDYNDELFSQIYDQLWIALNQLGRNDDAAKLNRLAEQLNVKKSSLYIRQGDDKYRHEHYNEAIEYYKQALQLGEKNASIYEKLGNTYIKLQKYQSADEAFEQSLKLIPTISVYIALGNMHIILHHLDKAQENYNQALKLDPHNAYVHGKQGEIFTLLEKYEEAYTCYRTATEYEKNAMYYKGMGYTKLELDDLKAALECYQQAEKLDQDDSEIHYQLGDLFGKLVLIDEDFHDGRWKALDHYQRGARNDPTNILLRLKLADALNLAYEDNETQKGLLEEALEEYNTILKLDPLNADAHYGKGSVLTTLNRHIEAAVSIESAIRIEPENLDYYFDYGGALHNLCRHTEMLTTFNTIIQIVSKQPLDPQNTGTYASAYKGKGDALFGLQRYDEALRAYDQAIIYDANYATGYVGRATILRTRGELQEALTACKQALNIHREYAEAYNIQGHVHMDLHEYDEALNSYEKAHEYDPTNLAYRYNKGHALMAKEHFTDALKEFEFILQHHPNHDLAMSRMGEIFYKIKDYKKSSSKHNEALSLTTQGVISNHPLNHYYLGKIYYRQFKLFQGQAEYERVLQLKKDFAFTEEEKIILDITRFLQLCQQVGRKAFWLMAEILKDFLRRDYNSY